jgi:tetratricopeptide (TPR) repeat protein
MWRKIAIAIFPVIALADSTPVILISVDTLRADRLGCYGYKKIRTPHFDSLAKGGTLFGAVDSPVPMTLPAHTSLLTSTYPFAHGVEENGQPVTPGAVTLAGVLKSHGYRTAAFIGGYVLDAAFGLDQGFDLYDSPFRIRLQAGDEPPDLRRPAETVLRGATDWLSTHADRPFFVFIHLYDVHQPYSHGYDAQVSYVDEQLGRFLRFLATKDLANKTLIVLTSDHGESLGEHGENTHGYFIYQSTLWTPLLIHWPSDKGPHATRVDEPASLIDVAPTILQSLAIPVPPQFQGRSLLKPGEEAVYAESMYARDHLGCSPLRSLRVGNYKYIQAPKPELYDLSKDPAELHNLYDSEKALARSLQERLIRDAPPQRPAPTPAAPEVVARLRSLGYLAGNRRASNQDSGPDPKDRLDEYMRYSRGIKYSSTGHLPEAIREFQEVLKQDPQNVLAHFYLAVCYHRSRRLDDSAKELDVTLAIAPDYWRAEELLGSIWLEKRDYVRAREQFTHLLKTAPGDYGAHYNLGILAIRDGRWDEALRQLRAAVDADPHSAPAHYRLGLVLLQQGKEREADQEFRQALAADPGFVDARKALEHVLQR